MFMMNTMIVTSVQKIRFYDTVQQTGMDTENIKAVDINVKNVHRYPNVQKARIM